MWNCYCYCTLGSLWQKTALCKMPSRLKPLNFLLSVSAASSLWKSVRKQCSSKIELSISTEIRLTSPPECRASYQDCIFLSPGLLFPSWSLPLLLSVRAAFHLLRLPRDLSPLHGSHDPCFYLPCFAKPLHPSCPLSLASLFLYQGGWFPVFPVLSWSLFAFLPSLLFPPFSVISPVTSLLFSSALHCFCLFYQCSPLILPSL